MSKLPRVSGQQTVTALERLGFRVRRQHGSHIILRRDNPFAQTVVPAHREWTEAHYEPFSDKPTSASRISFASSERFVGATLAVNRFEEEEGSEPNGA